MKYDAQHTEFGARIARYLSGEMDTGERVRFEDEIAADAEKGTLFSEYSKIWKGVDQLAEQSGYNMDEEWGILSDKMDLSGKNGLSGKTRKLRTFIFRAAAVLLIGLAGVAGWVVVRNMNAYEALTVVESPEIFELPDGSVVTMNAVTTMKYNISDNSAERRVILNGEAFFEIARDTARPFIIEAGSAVIEVLGTSFNVNAYKENETVEVTVHSGLVSMAAKNRTGRQILLNPGNAGVLYKSGKQLDIISTADPNDIAWKTRDLVFSGTPLNEVIRVVNHVYRSNIVIPDPALRNCTITVSFKEQELGAVLEVITSTLDLSLTREGDQLILTGEGCE